MSAKRVKWTIVLVLFVLTIVAIAALVLVPRAGPRKQIAAIRAAGLPASAVELDKWYETVPPEKNRALLLVEAQEELVKLPPDVDLGREDKVTSEWVEAAGEHLKKNEQALVKVHEAAQLPKSRFPVDFTKGFATLLPHLGWTKSLIQLLKIEAIYNAHQGKGDEAVRSLQSAFAISSSLQQEPIYISELVAIACVAITANTIDRVLNEIQFSEAQLVELSRTISQAEANGLRGLHRSLIGERAGGIGSFNATFKEYQAMTAIPPIPGVTNSNSGEWQRALGFQAYRLSGLRERDFALYLDGMQDYINSAEYGYPKMIQRSEAAQKELNARLSSGLGRFAIMSRMTLPALATGARKEAANAGKLRCIQVALAIERFRLQHGGELPTTLEELTPNYLQKLPTDPFDGAPLKYERLTGKGYKVTSIGATAERRRLSKTVPGADVTVSR